HVNGTVSNSRLERVSEGRWAKLAARVIADRALTATYVRVLLHWQSLPTAKASPGHPRRPSRASSARRRKSNLGGRRSSTSPNFARPCRRRSHRRAPSPTLNPAQDRTQMSNLAHADNHVDFRRLIEGLGAKRSSSGRAARCPAHDDRNPSLSINIRDG